MLVLKKIKEYFINYIENPPKKEYLNPQNSSIIEKIMKKLCGEDHHSNKEIVIYDKEDPYAAMYRNGSGYRDIEVENNKVKNLIVHYYYNA